MFELSDPHRFRKAIAGICMLCAPLVFLFATIVTPELKADEGAQLAVVADNADRWFMSHLALFVAAVLAVPAILGLMHMLRERSVSYGHVGGGLTLLGLLAMIGGIGLGFAVWQMAAPGADATEMTSLFERLTDTAGVWIPFLILPFAFGLGLIVLATGLYLAKAIGPAIAVALAVGGVLTPIAYAVPSGALTIVAAAFLFLGLGSIGWIVLMESEEDWEHTPIYGGHPLVGAR